MYISAIYTTNHVSLNWIKLRLCPHQVFKSSGYPLMPWLTAYKDCGRLVYKSLWEPKCFIAVILGFYIYRLFLMSFISSIRPKCDIWLSLDLHVRWQSVVTFRFNWRNSAAISLKINCNIISSIKLKSGIWLPLDLHILMTISCHFFV